MDNRGTSKSRQHPEGSGTPPEISGVSPETTVWLLKLAYYGHRALIEEALRVHGITVSQSAVLSRLLDESGLSGSEIARSLLVSPQAVQVALVSLEQLGLLERRPDPIHQRILRNSLTEEGRKVAKVCVAESLRVLEKPLNELDVEDRRIFVDLLRRLVTHLPIPYASEILEGS